MRIALLAARLALALAAVPALAQDAEGQGGPGLEGEYVQLVVGQRARLCPGGNCRSPICDDPATATITADGCGTLEARRPGFTTCSVDYGLGQRRILQVDVVARSGAPSVSPPAAQGEPPAAPGPAAPVLPPRPGGSTGRVTAPRTAPASPADDAPMYRWTAADGSIQFGRLEDVPPAQRGRAVRVTAEVSVLPAPPLPAVSTPPPSLRPVGPAEPRNPPPRLDPAQEIDLPPPGDAGGADTVEAGDLQCSTGASGRLVCTPYGQRGAVRPLVGPKVAPPASGAAGAPGR
jgi:hypothetical protein